MAWPAGGIEVGIPRARISCDAGTGIWSDCGICWLFCMTAHLRIVVVDGEAPWMPCLSGPLAKPAMPLQ